MDDGNERRLSTNEEMEGLSLRGGRCPRDLLKRFMGSGSERADLAEEKAEEIELSLGLSLGGRFGVNKTSTLMRSSSIAGSIPIVRDEESLVVPPPAYRSLMRTSSLPVETEEEVMKRKQLQTLRRMAAKRRRSEKQKTLKGDKDGGGGLGSSIAEDEKQGIEKSLRGKIEKEQYMAALKGLSSYVGSSSGLSTWAAGAARHAILDFSGSKGKESSGRGCGSDGNGQPSSRGSMESQGGSSSSMSELESQCFQESSSRSEACSTSLKLFCNPCKQASTDSSVEKTRNCGSSTSGADTEGRNKGKDTAEINSLENMPCVFTQGDGPNGKRVEGILYRYGKGEDVRIMCVCHGNFLSPLEFVKHAGGSDVTNPLKHIVVNPSSSSFF